MECEICGKETSEVKTIDLEGSTLIACPECASYGKEIESGSSMSESARPSLSTRIIRQPPAQTIRQPRFQNKELELVELIPDFGKVVRKAREGKGLTVKELAMKIFEKESLLHRIENQSIKPSDAIIAKLGKQLGVELKKKAE